MKPIYIPLMLLLGLLQYQLWWADGGLSEISVMKSTLSSEQARYQAVTKQNQDLVREIASLKKSDEEIESIARYDHNLIKEGETFYQIIEH